MSRGYRIRWAQPVWHNASTTVESGDAISMDVGILEILPESEMLALLRERLAGAGWTKDDDGTMRTTISGVDVTLAADGRTVTASATASQGVEVRTTQQAELNERLARASEGAKQQLTEKVAKQIIGAEAEIREKVQGALQRVYVEALRRKAASMGEIESVLEGVGEDGELELTIKVKV